MRGCSRLILPAAGASLLAWAGAAAGQMPTIDAVRTIRLSELGEIHSAVVSPDGSAIFVDLHTRAINVWAVLVHFWPHMLGPLSAAVALLLVVLARRMRSRGRTPGEPYCRRCNYHLAGHAVQITARGRRRIASAAAGLLCPECGTDLGARPPVVAGRARRVVAPACHAVAAVVLVGYGAMLAAGVPRDGKVSGWFQWLSADVLQWAEARKAAWAKPMTRFAERIVAVDLATGEIKRHVAFRPAVTWCPLRVSPDGARLLVGGRGGAGEVVCLDAGSGRTLGTLSGLSKGGSPDAYPALGFAPDGRNAYVADLVRGRIVAWDVRTGDTRDVSTFSSATVKAWDRRFVLLDGTGRALSAPSFSEAYQTGRYEVMIHEADGSPARTLELRSSKQSDAESYTTMEAAPMAVPAVTPDGSRFFIGAMSRGITGVDLRTGERLGTLTAPGGQATWEKMIVSPDGRYLVVATAPGGDLLLRDLDQRRWCARLRMPAAMLSPELSLSADGRWLAATGVPAGGPRSTARLTRETVVWDLSSLSRAATP